MKESKPIDRSFETVTKPGVFMDLSYADKCEGALIQAASDGDLEEVEKLIEEDVNINAVLDKKGETALLAAIKSGHAEVVECLLKKGASTKSLAYHMATPLQHALAKAPRRIVQLLMEYGTELEPGSRYSTLGCAIKCCKDFATIEDLLVVMAARDVTDLNRNTGVEGFLPLHFAISLARVDVVCKLLELGADPDAPNEAGETPADMVNKAIESGLSAENPEGYKKMQKTIDAGLAAKVLGARGAYHDPRFLARQSEVPIGPKPFKQRELLRP